ncbi:hypothetical protein [Lentibacillus sp. CBA3610]|uniref:hypothetical protein n=1 Tax=Lentibacillus sp. CBA3610 TaxID=2518176 RepID=UPI0015953BB5|nr:hypothetical protein [Lentibacillus sp. CBA3610]QKY70448.1 hypothetical protein Len3610_13370 [Lentibacillus sp. CBA3610]
MALSRIMKWLTGGCEAFLGFPIIGGSFILSTTWGALFVMFILHLVTLIVARNAKGSITGSILGMITSFIGIIPFIGMTMHIITAIVLLIDAGKNER